MFPYILNLAVASSSLKVLVSVMFPLCGNNKISFYEYVLHFCRLTRTQTAYHDSVMFLFANFRSPLSPPRFCQRFPFLNFK